MTAFMEPRVLPGQSRVSVEIVSSPVTGLPSRFWASCGLDPCHMIAAVDNLHLAPKIRRSGGTVR